MAYGKRSRQQAEEMIWLPEGADVPRFLLLFSGHHQHHASPDPALAPERVFECKTCNRQFPSFQALGGHRASHKKPRLADGVDGGAAAEPPKPKVHGCSKPTTAGSPISSPSGRRSAVTLKPKPKPKPEPSWG